MAIGPWPEVSLAKARHARDINRIKLAEGIDPMMERKRAKNAARYGGENTFAAVAREYIDQKMVGEGRAEGTLLKARWFLDLLKPAIGNMPISDVDPQMPAGKMKARRTHVVPLSRQVLALLQQLQEATSDRLRKYLFAALYTPRRPMSENTINASLRRMG